MYALHQDLIFIPVVLMVAITTIVYFKLSKVRIGLHKSGAVDPKVYKTNDGEPEASLQISNALRNQFEAPVLFYAVCLSAYVTQTVSILTLALSVAYIVFRFLHMSIHTGENSVSKRFSMFILSMRVLLIMWVSFAIQLLLKHFY